MNWWGIVQHESGLNAWWATCNVCRWRDDAPRDELGATDVLLDHLATYEHMVACENAPRPPD